MRTKTEPLTAAEFDLMKAALLACAEQYGPHPATKGNIQ
jgi:hypothetical protein